MVGGSGRVAGRQGPPLTSLPTSFPGPFLRSPLGGELRKDPGNEDEHEHSQPYTQALFCAPSCPLGNSGQEGEQKRAWVRGWSILSQHVANKLGQPSFLHRQLFSPQKQENQHY